MRQILLLTMFIFFSLDGVAYGQEIKKNVRYKSGKRINFESLLIEGEKKKADYSVVTGNLGESDFGLLKLRENFVDNMSNDAMEEIQ
jgi:hypothetical protein